MKPISEFKILNITPTVCISHYDLEAIKHIVNIAPKEAQWWHRCERIMQNNAVFYKIYEMYIPEQYCSAAEVETDDMMMVKFFKELSDKHGSEKANEIVQDMTVWCHSHHNMGVNPSGQDTKQFKEQIKMALDQKLTNPQLMFIFNKKNNFYCRIYDPELNLLFENPKLAIIPYDFNWINVEAKEKFKKKIVKIQKSNHSKPTHRNRAIIDWHRSHHSQFKDDYASLDEAEQRMDLIWEGDEMFLSEKPSTINEYIKYMGKDTKDSSNEIFKAIDKAYTKNNKCNDAITIIENIQDNLFNDEVIALDCIMGIITKSDLDYPEELKKFNEIFDTVWDLDKDLDIHLDNILRYLTDLDFSSNYLKSLIILATQLDVSEIDYDVIEIFLNSCHKNPETKEQLSLLW